MARWDDAVEGFEKNNNSVVISAGNEGTVEEDLESSIGNRQLRLPTDFETNVLENDLVTSVGAVDGRGTTRSAYSSESSGVDIYANGSLTLGEDFEASGTSFSSPRVGVTMAELHRLYPDMTSQQVESLMLSNLTENGRNGDSSIKVLKPDVNFEFLRNQKF